MTLQKKTVRCDYPPAFEIGDGLDLDPVVRFGQRVDADQGGGRHAALEELGAGAAEVGAVGHVDEIDRQLGDIGERAAAGLDQLPGSSRNRPAPARRPSRRR